MFYIPPPEVPHSRIQSLLQPISPGNILSLSSNWCTNGSHKIAHQHTHFSVRGSNHGGYNRILMCLWRPRVSWEIRFYNVLTVSITTDATRGSESEEQQRRHENNRLHSIHSSTRFPENMWGTVRIKGCRCLEPRAEDLKTCIHDDFSTICFIPFDSTCFPHKWVRVSWWSRPRQRLLRYILWYWYSSPRRVWELQTRGISCSLFILYLHLSLIYPL